MAAPEECKVGSSTPSFLQILPLHLFAPSNNFVTTPVLFLLEIPKQISVLVFRTLNDKEKNKQTNKNMHVEKLGHVLGEIILVFLAIELKIQFRTVLNRDCDAQLLSLQFSSFLSHISSCSFFDKFLHNHLSLIFSRFEKVRTHQVQS